jgi:hypothetical protein
MFGGSTLVNRGMFAVPRGLQSQNLCQAIIFSLQFLDFSAKVRDNLEFFIVHAGPDAPPPSQMFDNTHEFAGVTYAD